MKTGDARTYPLRKVVGFVRVPGRFMSQELLACGHYIGTANDIYGERYPESRRCRKCAQGKPPEYDVATRKPLGD